MRGPNFFLVGAAKSGTTTIYATLRDHDDVYLPAVKEPHLYAYLADPTTVPNVYPDEATARQRYRRFYAGVVAQRAVGDGSTTSLVVPGAAAAIARDVPSARIVAILRQPVDRAYSHFCHFAAAGGERTTDFTEAVRDEAKRQMEGFPFTYRYLGWSQYSGQLRPFFDLFGRERVLVHLYDDLCSDAEAVVRATLAFLEVDDRGPLGPIGEHNAVRAPRFSGMQRALRGGGRARQLVRRRIAASPLRGPLSRLTSVERPKPHLAPSVRAEMTEGFSDEIGRLEELLGRDLAVWR